MDPNPKKFPILSYVLSRISHLTPKSPTTSFSSSFPFDIEAPAPAPPLSDGLVEQMPHLTDPKLLASMTLAISDVAQTRSVLQALGNRPDHESMDNALAKISEIEEMLMMEQRPEEVDRLEKEKTVYRAVVQLDEMHEAYERLLKEAEERLVKIYDSKVDEEGLVDIPMTEEVNEEVVSVLEEASRKEIERVELSGRQLRILPEAFGKLRGLVVLSLSSNLLEVGS